MSNIVRKSGLLSRAQRVMVLTTIGACVHSLPSFGQRTVRGLSGSESSAALLPNRRGSNLDIKSSALALKQALSIKHYDLKAEGNSDNQSFYAVGGDITGSVMPSAHIALVIGNDLYSGGRNLTSAVADARLVGNALLSKGYKLVGGKAEINLNEIELKGAFEELTKEIQDKPGALVVVYFAGHGYVENDKTIIEPSKDHDPTTHQNGIAVVDVLDGFHRAGSGLTVMFLDDCRNLAGTKSASFVPEELPDDTFVGFSTFLGGIADDDDSVFAKQLSSEINSGIDNLPDAFLRITEGVENRKPIQLPVFEVGRKMPEFPFVFYPNPIKHGLLASLSNIDSIRILAQDCDANTRWDKFSATLQQIFIFKKTSQPDFIMSCIAAWKAGWRSKEVVRGVGLSSSVISILGGRSQNQGLIYQAAELGDGSAAMYKLVMTMAQSYSTQVIKNFMFFRYGATPNLYDANSIGQMQDFLMRRVLEGKDQGAAFQLSRAIINPSLQIIADHKIENPSRYQAAAVHTLITLSEESYAPAIVELMHQADIGRSVVNGLVLRSYMVKLMETNLSEEQNIDKIESFKELSDILQRLFVDLYSGQYGIVNQPEAYKLLIRIDNKYQNLYILTEENRISLCVILARSLISGRTPDGSNIAVDVARATRLLNYAAANGSQEAIGELRGNRLHRSGEWPR